MHAPRWNAIFTEKSYNPVLIKWSKVLQWPILGIFGLFWLLTTETKKLTGYEIEP